MWPEDFGHLWLRQIPTIWEDYIEELYEKKTQSQNTQTEIEEMVDED